MIHALLRGVGLVSFDLQVDDLVAYTVFGALDQTTETNFRGPLFGSAAALHLLCAAVLFLLAWVLFDFVETRAGKERKQRGLFGFDPWGGQTRVPRFSGNALVWKDYRLFVGGRRGMILRFAAYGIGVIALAWFYNPFGTFQRYDFGHRVLMLVAAGIVLDLGSLAGRVFRDEIAWQTYSTLLLLPKSVLQISYGKVMGCFTAIIPALCYMVIGMLCSSPEVLLLLGPAVFVFIALLYLLLPLIVYASLWLQRGAFPLTLFGFVITLAGVYFATGARFEGLCCGGLLLLLIAWRMGSRMHTKILDKLRELSGCDV